MIICLLCNSGLEYEIYGWKLTIAWIFHPTHPQAAISNLIQRYPQTLNPETHVSTALTINAYSALIVALHLGLVEAPKAPFSCTQSLRD